jgi:hypothetical protein
MIFNVISFLENQLQLHGRSQNWFSCYVWVYVNILFFIFLHELFPNDELRTH